jgi:hypothetical protein
LLRPPADFRSWSCVQLFIRALRPGPHSVFHLSALGLPLPKSSPEATAPPPFVRFSSPCARFSRRCCPGFPSYGSPEARRRVLLVLSPSSVALGLRGSEFFHECAAIGFSLHVLGFGAAGRLLICLPTLALGFAHRRAAVRSGFQSRALDLRAASGLVLGLRLFSRSRFFSRRRAKVPRHRVRVFLF